MTLILDHDLIDEDASESDTSHLSLTVDPLSLQELETIPATPADTYHSANSIYACIAMSCFSINC